MQSTVKDRPPRTIMEVFENLPEGTLAQLIENVLIISPSPLFIHQKILREIFIPLALFVKEHDLGEVLMAPLDVYLDQINAFQPDIMYVSKERQHVIENNGLHGAPDLVIEILSASTGKYDLEDKKDVYERSGVKEYWIIDPQSKSAKGYQLTGGIFEEIESGDGKIRSELLQTTLQF